MRLFAFYILLIMSFFSLSSAKESFDINRTGRKTQLDGFLMDWMEKNRRTWDGPAQWSWDAINTPDGIAGYFHADGATACTAWVFTVDAGHHNPSRISVSSLKDTQTTTFCTNWSEMGITTEWIISWESLALDSNNGYTITLAGNSACGDSLDTIVLTGKKPEKKTALPKYFPIKLIAIIVLLFVFFLFQARIRKKTLRRESPRQST